MGNVNSSGLEVVLEERAGQDFSRLKEKLAQEHALFAAAVEKNLARLGALLAVAGNPQRRDASQGFGVVHVCCLLGWVEGLERALEAGADINLASNSGYTPLMLASYSSLPDCCRLLLERGARPDLRSNRGSTATHFAAQSRCKEVLEQLLLHPANSGADVDSPGFRSRTPLHLAVLTHGEPAIINLLLGRGANASTRNTVLHGVTPLHTACHHGRVDALRALLLADADPNILSDDGLSPLLEVFAHRGLRHNEGARREMFSLLRDAGADLNVVLPRQGYTLLHFSMTSAVEEATVQLLLESGVDPRINVNRPLSPLDPRSKSTMLHRACKKGWANVTRSLVAAGADMSLRDRDGLTPLHVAVIQKRPECVDVLLAAGANPLSRAPNVFPSYAQWKMNRSMQAIQAMMEMHAEGFNALTQLEEPELEMTAVDMAACVPQWIPTVEVFLEHGVQPSEEAVELAEDTPLMRSVVERHAWTPELHALLPDKFKAATRLLLLCLRRATAAAELELPQQVVEVILTKAAWPVSGWADMPWLTQQHVKQPEAVLPGQPPFGMVAAAAGPGPGAAPGEAPPAGALPVPVFGAPPQAFIGVMNQVFQQLQEGINQALGGPPGQGEEETDDEEGEEEEEGQQEWNGPEPGVAAGPAHQAGPWHPLLGGLGALFGGLPGMPQMAGNQPNGPNMQVIQIQFNIPLVELDLGGGQHGLPGALFEAHPGPPINGPFFFPHDLFEFGAPGEGPGGAEEEGDAIEEEGMEGEDLQGAYPEAAASAAAPGLAHNQPPAEAAQQQESHAATCTPGSSAAGQVPHNGEDMPPLESDDESAGPSERAGGGRYNLRSRHKRQKTG